MSSCPKPRPKLSIAHIHRLLLGLSAFIVLCGIKTLHIMNMQTSKRTRAHWSVDETNRMLDLLIKNKARMGQAFSFPQSVYAEVAKQLGPDKNGTMVGSKWQSLKKTWRAISAYNSRSGCSFHATRGADVQSQAEQEAWDAFMATESSESKEMSQFRNKGWPFFEKMVELCPGGSGATGAYSFAPSESMSVDLGTSGDFDDLYADSSMMPDVAYPALDLDSLLQLGQNVVSTNPAMQSCAIENTFSVLNDVMPTPCFYDTPQSNAPVFSPSLGPFSDYPTAIHNGIHLPPSGMYSSIPTLPSSSSGDSSSSGVHLSTSHTTLVSSKVAKGKSKGRTSSRSKASSSLSANAAANRRSKLAQAEPSVAPALTGMTGAILRAADTMTEIKDLLVTAPTTPPAEAPAASSTSPEIFNIAHHASGILMADTALSAEIRAELALAFLTNPTLCQMYVDLTDPLVRHRFAQTWFQKNCGTESAEGSSGSDARLAGTGGDRFSVYQDDQSNFM
ncbi:hypothetical protein EDD15DRAFT_2363331 [Pisolithus albus]|nr:hypothetical protein EDD15DRAFT_2363331 [Pisolithus albus]